MVYHELDNEFLSKDRSRQVYSIAILDYLKNFINMTQSSRNEELRRNEKIYQKNGAISEGL